MNHNRHSRNFTAAVVLCVAALSLAGAGQQAPDPIAALRRTGERLLADLDRMPNYTCVQTITRSYHDARAGIHRPSCSALIEAHNARKNTPPVFAWDRVRLEVALVEGNNVFSWVGAPRFANDNLETLAGNGPLGSGDFGVFIREILLRAKLDFRQEQVINGKRLLEYSYDMPLEKSTYKVKTSDGWTQTAYSGTLLLDPEAADLVKLMVRTPKLPASSSACQATSEITYGRTSIHGRLVLIPRETRLNIINLSGSESWSQTSFGNCREYASTVRLLPDGPKSTAGPHAAIPAAAGPPASLPAGLHFDARIITPIDSDTAAAGDPIEAVLRSPMHGKNKAVIAPAGVRLHGHLTGVRWRSEPASNHQITVRFESIEIDGRNVPFSAILEPPHPAVLTGTGGSMARMMPLEPDDPSLGGTFSFRQEHLRLKNLDAQWVTVAR